MQIPSKGLPLCQVGMALACIHNAKAFSIQIAEGLEKDLDVLINSFNEKPLSFKDMLAKTREQIIQVLTMLI